MSEPIHRREFLLKAGAYSLAMSKILGAELQQAWGAQNSLALNHPPPYFDVPDDAMINVIGQHLRFGSSVGPFKDPDWTLSECRDIGFTSIRIALPREHCEKGPNNGPYDQNLFHNPYPDATRKIRQAKFEVIMLLHGHPANRKEVPQEWPRYPDGTINGKAAAQSFANYTRWMIEHMGDFVHKWELWNEAFGHIEDQKFNKSFGPGGSKQNADNYSDMMLPAMAVIKRHNPQTKTIIEGNYWNIAKSVANSPGYLKLLEQADYVVKHPYGYGPKEYTRAGKNGKGSWDFEAYDFYRKINPKIKWIYTEYNITELGLGVPPHGLNGELQAKGVLRTTVLHMRHGMTELYPFALCYPQSPEFTFTEKDHRRRPVWFAMKRFMAACAPKQHSIKATLQREGIPDTMRDLAVSTPDGFTYCIWQETKPPEWKNPPPIAHCTVRLSSSNGCGLKLIGVLDPITGKDVANVEARLLKDGLSLSLPVRDYPLLCMLRAIT